MVCVTLRISCIIEKLRFTKKFFFVTFSMMCNLKERHCRDMLLLQLQKKKPVRIFATACRNLAIFEKFFYASFHDFVQFEMHCHC